MRNRFFDFIQESVVSGIYFTKSLYDYKNFIDKYPFIGIRFNVKEKADANDEIRIPQYKIKVLQIDNVVGFWSEKIEDWMQFRKDINETFKDFSYIELQWGKSENDPSYIKICTDEFCTF